MNKITNLFLNREWKQIVKLFTVNQVVHGLLFEDCLRLAYRLLYNKEWDENLQEYAIQLLYAIRNYYPKEWDSSWKHDGFLGVACDIRFKFDEKYQAFKRAFEGLSNPPPELLIQLASCVDCPGKPPISRLEAIDLLKKAIKNHTYIDAVGQLHKIYWELNDNQQANYWKEQWEKLEAKNEIQSPAIEPRFLIDEYLEDEKKSKKDQKTN